ncbi:MAG: hypothetical protein RI943_1537, partial [Bacteroidota bacterium]
RAFCKVLINNFNGALEDYNIAILLNPKNEKYFFDKGALLIKLNRFNEALEAFNEAIKIDSKLARAYAGRAFAKHKLNEIEGACADIKTAKDLGFDVNKLENLIKCK